MSGKDERPPTKRVELHSIRSCWHCGDTKLLVVSIEKLKYTTCYGNQVTFRCENCGTMFLVTKRQDVENIPYVIYEDVEILR